MTTSNLDVRVITEISDIADSPRGGSHTSYLVFGDGTPNTGLLVKQLPTYELARELVCALVANAVGLPVARPYIVDLNATGLPGQRWAFGSEYVRTAQKIAQDEAILERLNRWPLLPLAVAFDELIGNEDRTLKNILYVPKSAFLLINHGAALPDDLQPQQLLRSNLLADRVAGDPSGRSSPKQRVLAAAATLQFDGAQIEVAAKGPAWGGGLMANECLRLLHDRRQYLQDLIASRFDPFQRRIQWP